MPNLFKKSITRYLDAETDSAANPALGGQPPETDQQLSSAPSSIFTHVFLEAGRQVSRECQLFRSSGDPSHNRHGFPLFLRR